MIYTPPWRTGAASSVGLRRSNDEDRVFFDAGFEKQPPLQRS